MSGAETPATEFLTRQGIAFERFEYAYEERGGAGHAAECLGVPGSMVIKTLVMEPDGGDPVLVLMHGDRRVSSKRLSRQLGVRRVRASSPETAFRRTGYVVGGISPFGTRTELTVYAEATIFELEQIWINGGRRGLLLQLSTAALQECLSVHPVQVAADPS